MLQVMNYFFQLQNEFKNPVYIRMDLSHDYSLGLNIMDFFSPLYAFDLTDVKQLNDVKQKSPSKQMQNIFDHAVKTPISKNPNVSEEHCLKPSDLKKKPKAFEALNNLLEKEVEGKNLLKTMREKINAHLLADPLLKNSGQSIGQISGAYVRNLMSRILKDGENVLEKTLGIKPPCEYSCSVFGSTARDDGGTHPDLDYAFIIAKKTPENLKYFEKLSQYLADRIHRLGEDESGENYGIHTCYGGATPFFMSYDWRYQNPDYAKNLQSLILKGEERMQYLKQNLNQIKKKSVLSVKDQQDIKMWQEELTNKAAELSKNRDLLRKDDLLTNELFGRYIDIKYVKTRGTVPLIAEPKELAQWSQAKIDELVKKTAQDISEKHQEPAEALERQIKNIGIYTDILPVDSSSSKVKLVEQYKQYRAEFLQGKPEKTDFSIEVDDKTLNFKCKTRAQELFASTIIPNALSYTTKASNKGVLDIKKAYWRFPQTFIAFLCDVHGIKESNTFKRIEQLMAKKIINPEFAAQLHSVYSFLVSMRAKCQMHYGSEIHDVFETEKAKQHFLKKFYQKEGKSLEACFQETKKDLKDLKKDMDVFKLLYPTNNKSPAVQEMLKIFKARRKNLAFRLTHLNDVKALQNGLVLNKSENDFIKTQIKPFLDNLKTQVIDYVKKGEWKTFA